MDKILYITAVIFFAISIYMMIARESYFHKIVGLGILQTGVLIFYTSLGKINGGIVPVNVCLATEKCDYLYSNPLPQVLMLTAIVVGFATLSVGLSLLIKIQKFFGSLNEDEIQ